MKVSVKWLNDFIDLSGVSTDELVERLTAAGLEVGEVNVLGDPHIVVGRIDSIEDHPKADRLVMCKLDVGDGNLRNIACGATNMSVGDVVPVALPGAKPPGLDFGIESRKVVGVVSEGMLCAEEELGLADKSDGLWILDGDLKLGQPVFEALGIDDVVIGIDLTPNRPDCLSHQGVAREVAALLEIPFSSATAEAVAETGEPVEACTSLVVEDTEGCPRYTLAVIENVKVGPSPAWLTARLNAIGVRSINNIVDVTNYLLNHVGQPLHAFDLDTLDGGIVVRRARDIEELVGIDHKTHNIDGRDLVIADASKPVAIAGVMGGESTEVTEKTTRILIECAYFNPTSVRKSSKRLGLHTESSHRFERGIDPGATATNLELAVALMVDVQRHLDGPDPVVRAGRIEAHPHVVEKRAIGFQTSLVSRILGVDIDDATIGGLLERLGMTVTSVDGGFDVVVPTFRPDIERPIDLVEEVARLYGYDNIEPKFAHVSVDRHHTERPQPGHPPTIVPSAVRREMSRIRSMLLGYGLFEAVNYSFMAPDAIVLLELSADDPRRRVQRISNPLTQDATLMRTTLCPSLLKTLATNVAQRQSNIAVFEVGRIYEPQNERLQLGMLVTGAIADHFADAQKAWDFFDVKGMIESLVYPFDLGATQWSVPDSLEPYLHPGVQAELKNDQGRIALLGQFHPAQMREHELDHPVFYVEIELDAVLSAGPIERKLQPLPRYPAVTRDFAFLYDRHRAYSDLHDAVHSLAASDDYFGDLLESVALFDVYEGEQIPDDKRSLALKIVYRSAERTLKDSEVADADARLLGWLEREVGAERR